jgi:hypothetical protein
VALPAISNNTARLKIEATGNIYFDISDTNFSLRPGIPQPVVNNAGATLAAEGCTPANGVLDPNETVTINFALQNTGTANTTNLVATLLATGGVSSPSAPQTYGTLTAGGASVSRSFTFTATGTCGGTVTTVLQLQDGPTNHGTITNVFNLGIVTPPGAAFTNATPISIPSIGAGTPYPSTITVAGVAANPTKVTVRLAGLTHSYADDIDILLVGPGGQKVMLMSDAGGGNALSGVNLTFDDSGSALPNSTAISSGTYRPTDQAAGDALPAPAPSTPYGTSLSVFTNSNPGQQDLDNDTLGDACDPDIDGDGLPNAWETASGLDPYNPADAGVDTDGDGFTNAQEYRAGTDPQNSADALRITNITMTGGDILISFTTASNKLYELQRSLSPSLSSPATVTNNYPGTGAIRQVTDPGAALTTSNFFYRVRLQP